MSKYVREGYLYFPPVVIGGPSGDYMAACPMGNCEEAEFEVMCLATLDTVAPKVLVTGDTKPKQLDYTGSVQMGVLSGTDQGSQAFPGVAMAWGGANIPSPPVGEFFAITDAQKRVFVRVDCANNQSLYVTLRYRVRPVRTVVGNVHTVPADHEVQHNLAREHAAMQRLNSETIKGRGEAVNL